MGNHPRTTMGKKKAAEQEEVSEEEVSEEEVVEEVAETKKKKKKKKSEEAGEEPEKKTKKKKSEEQDEQGEDQQEVSQKKGKKRPAEADAEGDPEAQKQLDQHIARLESLQGPEHARVRARIFKKIGRLRAKLDGERPRSKPLIAKAAQKKRRKKLIFGDQVPYVKPERDTRPQRLRKKEAAAAGPVTVVLVGGLPWEVLDQQLKDKIDKTGKVLNGGIVKCQVAMNRKGLSRGFGFVELQNEGDAKGLVAAMNESEWEGRIMSAKVVPGRDAYTKPAAAAPDQNAESKPEQAQQPAEPSDFVKKAPDVNTVKASQSKVVKF